MFVDKGLGSRSAYLLDPIEVQALNVLPMPVLVIGGGVVGVGCALDAATRGLRVALVEARDPLRSRGDALAERWRALAAFRGGRTPADASPHQWNPLATLFEW